MTRILQILTDKIQPPDSFQKKKCHSRESTQTTGTGGNPVFVLWIPENSRSEFSE